MQSKYTTNELAALWEKPASTILRWADNEKWSGEKRKGRGGGMVWYVCTMPEARRVNLQLRHSCRSAVEDYGKQSREAVNRKARAQALVNVSERGVRKVEAQMCVINAVDRMAEESGLPPTVVMEEFTVMYRKRQAPVPEWVYAVQPKISRCTIRLWKINVEKEGMARLAKQYKKRTPRNLISQSPQLESFLVGMIEEYPHVSGKALFAAAHARFGVHGTAPDPSVKIPSERRMQSWLSRWKKDNEQLYQHILDPDAWRSAHKMALGNASAHVVALNQEWQADSTVCDLILNDGKRHSIIAIIDVYSRRVRFHVSRTSSAAAVASCFRKALLDWGVCDTFKTDNGSDYVSNHMKRIITFLEIDHDICPPFTPEHKPHVERVFKTFLHQHVELMQGYIGHNVAQRKGIEARKSFAERLCKKMLREPEARLELAVSPEELQRVCDAWAEAKYGNAVHGSLDGKTPNQKAAEYTGPVYRIEDERALDVLLLPCPGKNGLRTVSKKGIRLTNKVHGFSLGGHYIGTDLVPLEGRNVLVRMDDTNLGLIRLFDPTTHEYLGKAEHPGLCGWSAEKVRQVAVNAVRNQKAFITKARKQTKAAAKAADVKDIASEILQSAIRQHAEQPARTTPEQTVVFVNKSLEQAVRTFTGDFTPPTEAQQEKAMAKLAQLTQSKPKGFVVPENPSAKMDLWNELYDKITAGESVGEAASSWVLSFSHSPICKASCKLRGIVLPQDIAKK